MEQALAYVCCSAEESRVKVQKYCRKIYELGYVPICPRFVFSPFLEESDAEDMQGYGRMSHILLRRCRMVLLEKKYAVYLEAGENVLEALQPTEKERSLIVDNAKLLLIGEFMDAYGYEKTFENEKFVIFE